MTNENFSKDVFRKRRLWAGIAAGMLTACALPANADSFTYTGAAQSFTASATGIYQIVAYGAQGGDSNNYQSPVPGGAGAETGGSFLLSAGETLTIDVGGQGGNDGTGGGGGGTFVTLNGTPLAIAGGGGGADFGFIAGQPGLATTSGGAGGPNAAGGSGGQGGEGGGQYGGGGGAGFYGNGGDGLGGGGSDYPSLAGGAGWNTSDGFGGPGGYGGGGGAGEFYGGGGGGYSGGGGGDDTGNSAGGGGGSYLDASATDAILFSGVETGNGTVTITEVMATTPEPSSLTLFGFGMCLVGIGLVIPRKSCRAERSRD